MTAYVRVKFYQHYKYQLNPFCQDILAPETETNQYGIVIR